jgi:dTDP-4-dehydrorhamnose reductase
VTSAAGRIAVTGAGGRLGSALVNAARVAGEDVIAWRRPEFDLDAPESIDGLIRRDRPRLVAHAAAWTDVEGCAHDPALASRRNGDATGVVAAACASAGVALVVISTNEVFDGTRPDERGYREDDEPHPRNPYGRSKLAGEEQARSAFAAGAGLWIVRTAWLFGPPGNDFPHKVIAAADRLPDHEPLAVVADEIGSPTYAPDLAEAIVRLVSVSSGGLFHLVNRGTASRVTWAEAVLRTCRPGRRVRPISRNDYVRASDAPAWAVLDSGRAAVLGVTLRPWSEALADYLEPAS